MKRDSEKRLRRERADAARDHEEELKESFEDWTQVRRLWKYLRPRRGRIAVAILLSVVLSLMMLAPAVLTKHVVDDYIAGGNMDGVLAMCGVVFLAMLAILAVEAFTSYAIARIGQESMKDLRMDLFRHLCRHSLRFYDKRPVGWLVTRMTSDVNVLNELFAQGVVGIFQQIFMLLGIVGVLFFYNPVLAAWSLVLVPMVLVLSRVFRNAIRVSYRLTRARLSRLNTHVQENVTGMRAVQANTREDAQFSRFELLNDLHREAHFRTVFAYSVYFPMIELIAAIGIGLVIWKGGEQYLADRMTVGELILFVSLLERFFQPIKDLSEKFNLVQSAIAASERLFKLVDEEPAITDPETPAAAPAFAHSIEFDDVWFAYNEEDWVLKGVSFRIEKGQNVAIVGPTGSGKTTLMSLLCRFYDIQKGRILIDGVDIREMRQADLRGKIAIVLQDVFLFRGSVEENIRLGEEGISRAQVEAAAQAVNAAPFIERLPKGYESGVMERGATLSVGQKQLLAFARALAFEPEILILDEATSNIDTETEQLIQQALDRLTVGRTALVIAHRLSTIQKSDKILVLRDGRLAEEGTHQELLAMNGLYRRLYELQYREESLT